MVRRLIPLAVCLLSAGSSGCYPAPKSGVPGRYALKAEWGESTLELRNDGTFVEEAVLKNGDKKRAEGKWEHKSSSVIREPCLSITHEGVAAQNIDVCHNPVEKWLLTGVTEISVYDPDYGMAYRK